ncbi:MAG: Mth938-like domain-containing protein [Elusimicrobiota bacterium]
MHVDDYSFGKIVIDGKTYTSDVLIAGGKIKKWWRDRGHLLQNTDLKEVWSKKPDILIVGKGASGVMSTAPEVKEKCKDLGIEFFAAKSRRAVKKFNELTGKKETALGIHLTC